jgi:hypothetical protein
MKGDERKMFLVGDGAIYLEQQGKSNSHKNRNKQRKATKKCSSLIAVS